MCRVCSTKSLGFQIRRLVSEVSDVDYRGVLQMLVQNITFSSPYFTKRRQADDHVSLTPHETPTHRLLLHVPTTQHIPSTLTRMKQ